MNPSIADAAGGQTVGPDRAPAELLDVGTVAVMLGCSRRHVHRMADAGRMPRPFKFGQLVRWRRAAILEWLDAGCPSVRDMKGGAR
jgi:excisionase family DNA binding protein